MGEGGWRHAVGDTASALIRRGRDLGRAFRRHRCTDHGYAHLGNGSRALPRAWSQLAPRAGDGGGREAVEYGRLRARPDLQLASTREHCAWRERARCILDRAGRFARWGDRAKRGVAQRRRLRSNIHRGGRTCRGGANPFRHRCRARRELRASACATADERYALACAARRAGTGQRRRTGSVDQGHFRRPANRADAYRECSRPRLRPPDSARANGLAVAAARRRCGPAQHRSCRCRQ